MPFDAVPALQVRTTGAPGVVRFRPRDGQDVIPRNSALSVRFTERMDRTTTAAAFHATAAGVAVPGTARWAEGATVLVFTPSTLLPYGAAVELRVDATATSRAGVALATAATATFTVEPKPAASKPKPPATKPAQKPPAHKPPTKPIPKPPSGGGGAVNGSWTGVESYYLHLMNCTRTGGWVTSGGKCSSPGGRAVAPLEPELGDQRPRLAPVREAARRPTTSATTSSAARRATASATRATPATAGARTSAAGRATRSTPSSARTCSSRASAPTTAVTTATSWTRGSTRSASGCGWPADASGW